MSHTGQRRPKASNQPSQLLSNSENQQLFQIIGNRCVVSHIDHCRILIIFAMAFLPAATKLGQVNIFTSVCQEFCPQGGVGVCLSACWDTPPPPSPPDQAPAGGRHHPPDQAPPQPGPPPQSRHPPGKQTAAYGQRVTGTHPTGMHSCKSKF